MSMSVDDEMRPIFDSEGDFDREDFEETWWDYFNSQKCCVIKNYKHGKKLKAFEKFQDDMSDIWLRFLNFYYDQLSRKFRMPVSKYEDKNDDDDVRKAHFIVRDCILNDDGTFDAPIYVASKLYCKEFLEKHEMLDDYDQDDPKIDNIMTIKKINGYLKKLKLSLNHFLRDAELPDLDEIDF